MNSFQLAVRAEAIAETLGRMTGYRPQIAYGPDFARLYWTEAQKAVLSTKLGKLLDRAAVGAVKPADPGPIRIEYAPIINPAIAKRAAPVAMGAALLLAGLGYMIGRGVRK